MTVRTLVSSGLLELELVRGADGRTRVSSATQRFPQRVTAPMYLDEQADHAAYLCVQNPTGGIFPDDRLRTKVTVHPGAHLQLTSQSATQVYAPRPEAPGVASHLAELTVHPGAVLEHPQRTTIPHRDSSFHQSTQLRLHGDAVYLGWEAVAAGRIGHGERFGFSEYRADTTIWHEDIVLAREVTMLRPGARHPGSAGVLAGHDYFASFLALAPGRPTDRLAADLVALLSEKPGVHGAASPLPGRVGVAARLLAHRAPALIAALTALWAAARAELLKLDPPPRRML